MVMIMPLMGSILTIIYIITLPVILDGPHLAFQVANGLCPLCNKLHANCLKSFTIETINVNSQLSTEVTSTFLYWTHV